MSNVAAFRTYAKKYTNLKDGFLIRYADDFKIFTSSYPNAVKLFHATKDWLKERLGLDISPEKILKLMKQILKN